MKKYRMKKGIILGAVMLILSITMTTMAKTPSETSAITQELTEPVEVRNCK